MRILSIDCTFGGHSVALLQDCRAVATAHHRNVHATEGAMSAISKVLDRAQADLNGLDAVACGVGPGLFSGIRAACGISQGIAHVNGLRVAAVNSMLALAHASCCEKAIVAYPAHRGHCYMAAYENVRDNWKEHMRPSLHAMSSLPRFRGDWQVCARKMSDKKGRLAGCVAGKASTCDAWRGSLATAIGQIGTKMAAMGETVDPVDALPLYVRNKVATTVRERQAMARP